jgi:hypothetical protein
MLQPFLFLSFVSTFISTNKHHYDDFSFGFHSSFFPLPHAPQKQAHRNGTSLNNSMSTTIQTSLSKPQGNHSHGNAALVQMTDFLKKLFSTSLKRGETNK